MNKVNRKFRNERGIKIVFLEVISDNKFEDNNEDTLLKTSAADSIAFNLLFAVKQDEMQ